MTKNKDKLAFPASNNQTFGLSKREYAIQILNSLVVKSGTINISDEIADKLLTRLDETKGN